jgi:hypothetical protein
MVSHRILLRGLGPLSTSDGPLLLKRTDQELIPVLLEQLQGDKELTALAPTVARQPGDPATLRLFQPVQRAFYIALFEAVCELPGYPRVDPQAIESAGMVVRRIGPNGRAQGWLAQQSTLRGWIELDAGAADEDPDSPRRRALSTGNALIDSRLALLRQVTSPLAEAVTPLYVAPPEVGERLGKTVLYGLVPVTSAEFAERPASNVVAPDKTSATYAQLVAGHLPPPLRAGKRSLELAGRALNAGHARAAAEGSDDQTRKFVALLRQIAVELDAFGASVESLALFAELNSIKLTLPGGSRQGMGDFFKQATAVLVAGEAGEVLMPVEWPMISDAQAQRITQLVVGALGKKIVADEQGEQRFARPGAFYHVRGFVRVVRDPQCPPQLYWSGTSENYQIAPWYEGANMGLPLPKIELPDPFDRNALKQLKPNVSFRVPEKLFDLMNAMDPAKVMDGKQVAVSDKFGLDWICSFSIPFITICAFIVLNIFLSLFDLFFQWLLFIKICIPVPKKVSG